MASHSPEQILARADMETPRTAKDLLAWVQNRISQFSTSTELVHALRLRRGLCQQLCEEILPFSLYCEREFGARVDVFCIPCIGSQPYDARIVDTSAVPTSDTKVEITFAIDGHAQSIRMEALNEKGQVATTGPLPKTGTRRRGRDLDLPLVAVSSRQIVSVLVELILAAISKKLRKPYPDGYILVVGCEDGELRLPSYVAGVEAGVREAVAGWKWGFSKIVVVGTQGRLFFQV